MNHRLPEELEAWREAYDHLRKALGVTMFSKCVPQDKKDAFLLKLDLLSDDAEDLGDVIKQRIKAQKMKPVEKTEGSMG